jgi:hypothetical protein
MAQEPHQEIQEKWVECEKSWTKINRAMRDIDLPEFGTPDDFVDLHDIVKLHVEQDSSWAAGDRKGGEHGARSSTTVHGTPDQGSDMLQQLSARIVKYRARAVEIKEILSAPMDQHRFPYANTCEDLFVKWSEYEKSHPLK